MDFKNKQTLDCGSMKEVEHYNPRSAFNLFEAQCNFGNKMFNLFNFPNTGFLKGILVPSISCELLAQVLIGKVSTSHCSVSKHAV